MGETVTEKISAIRKDISKLKDKIAENREKMNDTSLSEFVKDSEAIILEHKVRATLRGHLAKIYAMQWDETSNNIVSISQDGRMILWDARLGIRTQIIPLRSTWMMTCAYGPLDSSLVACGGLDNNCSIYDLRSRDTPVRPIREMSGHTGYLSCCRFLSGSSILSASGDMSCILWDIEKGQKISSFTEHNGDVMCVSVSPDKKTFLSGACDAIAKLWDIRTATCVQSFSGHESDIGAVQFFPNGLSFATGSDDSTCKIYDLRADRELQSFKNDDVVAGVTSVSFSKSGRVLYSGYEDCNCFAWDVLTGSLLTPLQHPNRVSCLEVNNEGTALATGCWDSLIRVWA